MHIFLYNDIYLFFLKYQIILDYIFLIILLNM